MLIITDRAREVLEAARAAAHRFDPEARIRIRRGGPSGVIAELVADAEDGEEVLELDGLMLIVEAGLVGTIDAGEHNVLMLSAQEPGTGQGRG